MSRHGAGFCSCHEVVQDSDNGGQNLLPFIDTANVAALNENIPNSSVNIFKPWDARLDYERILESSDDDPELILHVPFKSLVKLTSFILIGGSDGTAPLSARFFTNRDDVDFSTVHDMVPVQEFELVEDLHGSVEYTTRISKFQNISSLTIHFPAVFGGDRMRIVYLALKGEGTQLKRQAVSTTYESRPQLSDHSVRADQHVPQNMF